MTLPSVVFWSALAIFFTVPVREERLTIREAVLEVFGRSKPALRGRHIAFLAVMGVGTLGLWYWLSEDCRAALT